MQIFIPTRDRVNAQFTWEQSQQRAAGSYHLGMPAGGSRGPSSDAHRNAVARPALPLAGVRQWIVDELARQGEPVIMLDDDLSFLRT
jgi:hypothetical protein